MVIFLIVVLFLILFVSFLAYMECFHSPASRADNPYASIEGEQYADIHDNMLAITRIMERAQAEEVTIHSYDGLLLKGRYYQTNHDAPILILFHGYRSHPSRDCAGAYMLGKKMGFNILAVDQRAHCKSGGRVITFGICERHDCASWAEYAASRFPDSPIVLAGLSMGAATVLMASELKLPKSVCAILADCPYSSPSAIIRKVCIDRKIPDWLAYPFVQLGARLFGGFPINKCSAEDAVKHANVPILLLHGEDDRFVPCDMSKAIHSANPDLIRLHTFPYAGHGLCYMTDPIRYEQIVTRFLWDITALKRYMTGNTYVHDAINGNLKY